MDFLAGREDRIASVLDRHEFDYVVGSVHFIREHGAAVDWDVWDIWESVSDPDKVWKLYFDHLAEAARTGLYDILAHPDLVKVWGDRRPLPQRDPRFYYEPVIEAIAEIGIAIEFSTAGWRKPVGEQYPSRAFAEMCLEAGAAVRPLVRRPPSRAGRLRVRARGRDADATGGSRRSACSRAASAVWSRWDEGRDRLRQPPVRRRPAARPRRASRSSTSRARRALRRRRRHPRRDRRAARGRRPRRPRRALPPGRRDAGATPTRSTCCARSSACSTARSPTSTRP